MPALSARRWRRPSAEEPLSGRGGPFIRRCDHLPAQVAVRSVRRDYNGPGTGTALTKAPRSGTGRPAVNPGLAGRKDNTVSRTAVPPAGGRGFVVCDERHERAYVSSSGSSETSELGIPERVKVSAAATTSRAVSVPVDDKPPAKKAAP